MYKYKWKPNNNQKIEFKNKMKEIESFCKANSIDHSRNYDSYYFSIDNKYYRVSNHSIEKSNQAAYNELGVQIRSCYHAPQRLQGVNYIHASKTRIIEIYHDLQNGYVLDGRGYRKEL